MERESPSAFARRLGVNKSTISRAIAAGRLLLVDGLLPVEDSLRLWQSTQTGYRPDVAARHAAKRRQAAPSQPQETGRPAPAQETGFDESFDAAFDDTIDPAAASSSLADYARRRLAAENALARLELHLRTHRRYPLDALLREAQSIGSTLRGALERLVDQTAPRLTVLHDQQSRQSLIETEARRIRHLVRRELARGLRRLRLAGARK